METDWLIVSSCPSFNDNEGYVGTVDAFRLDGGRWVFHGEIRSPHPGALERFGSAIAIQDNLLLVGVSDADDPATGASEAGVVYVYRYR